jgi:O-antigen/teichoic acid export membrane protein
MVLVVSSFVLVFSDVALGAALVQRQELSEDDRSTVFWTSVGVGAFFTAVGVALAGPAARFYGVPAVRPLLAALSLGFLVNALATTQEALLVRELRFRQLEVRMMLGTAGGAVVGITLAALGFGAWALIGQQLAIGAVSTTLLWLVSPWKPRLSFSLASLRKLGGFSGNVFAQRVLFYLHRNADNLLVGRFLGAAALGAYALAYNVMLVPFSRLGGPVQEVLFPAFARLQDQPARIAEIWVRATRLVGAVTVPALAGLVVVAPDFVRVVLGARWHQVVPVLQILSWVGLLQSLQTLNSNILQALDRTGVLLRYAIVFFSAHLCAFVIGLRWGIVGVAAGYAVSSTIVEPLYAWVTTRTVGIPLLRLVGGLRGVAAASAVMAVGVLALRLALEREGIPPLPRLALCVVAGALLYLPACGLLAPELRIDVRRARGAAA